MRDFFSFVFFFLIIEKNLNTEPHKPAMCKRGKCRLCGMLAVLTWQHESLICWMWTRVILKLQAAVCLVCLREVLSLSVSSSFPATGGDIFATLKWMWVSVHHCSMSLSEEENVCFFTVGVQKMMQNREICGREKEGLVKQANMTYEEDFFNYSEYKGSKKKREKKLRKESARA